MTDIAKKMFRGDRVVWMIFVFLCFISIVEVYSASSMLTFKTASYWQPIVKHTLFLFTGLVVVLIIHAVPPKFFRIFGVMLPFVWLLLIATQLFGVTINDTNRYIFGFQPSEFAKLCLITTVAYIIRMQEKMTSDKWSFNIIWILSAVTCGLIMPDNLSTAVLLYGVVGIMIFIGQFSYKRVLQYFISAIAVVVLVFTFAAIFPDFSKKIGLDRAVTWTKRLNNYKEKPEITKDGKIPDDRFQEVMAKIAVARGGLKIIGIPGSSQQSDLLPQAYSDFIYAIIIEETGVIGGIVVLLLYVFLFIRAGTIAGRCKKPFPKILVMGCALMLIVQAFVSMAVSVGLMPVTGQPLPLVSKGGTSIISTCIFIGIILSVSRYENPVGIKHDVEFEEEFEEERRLAKINEQVDVQAI